MRPFLFAICLVSLVCHAQEAVQIPSLVSEKSGKARCLADFDGRNKRCWILKSVQPFELPNTSSQAKFTKIRLVELGLRAEGSNEPFVIGISWEAEGRGLLSISGPKGTLFAVGEIAQGENGKIQIQTFADESFSQQFDRAVVFGESDPEVVRQKTRAWLNEVIAPFLKKYLFSRPTQVQP